MADSVVIIPTYNEKENIQAVIEAVFSLPVPPHQAFHILVIDDGSPDGTAAIVKKCCLQYPHQLFLLERFGKLGLDSAYLEGFAWALEKGYNYICEMDAGKIVPIRELF